MPNVTFSAFRIQNYRSIIDTGWEHLSSDNITAFIGQNESGKTNILQALESFFIDKIKPEDIRESGVFPTVACEFLFSKETLDSMDLADGLYDVIVSNDYKIRLKSEWTSLSDYIFEFDTPSILDFFENLSDVESDEEDDDKDEEDDEDDDNNTDKDAALKEIWSAIPAVVFFKDEDLLPDAIDLDDLLKENKNAKGYVGTKNYLKIAKLSLDELNIDDKRLQEDSIQRGWEQITANFRVFWSQTVSGMQSGNKVEIRLEKANYDNTFPEPKRGKPYLEFWVYEGGKRQYMRQRSRGLRWFFSFYLQLQASALDDKNEKIFLIDEPGASLHANAQKDALKLFEEIKSTIQILYTTHSPYLLDKDTIHRIIAVERQDNETNDTKVNGINRLGGANRDTLSPLYAIMGVDFSHQNIIKKENNILLEEISAWYYLKAFAGIIEFPIDDYSFIPVSGADNIPLYVRLFLGWGLDYFVVLDGDQKGKRVFRKLKKEIFFDDKEETEKYLMTLPDGISIEDLFSKEDFCLKVLNESLSDYKKVKSNSDYVKTKSKGVLASRFASKCVNGEFQESDFSVETIKQFRNVLDKIKRNNC